MEVKAIDFKQLKKYESFSSVAEMDKSTNRYIEYLQGKGVRQSVIDVLLCLGASSLRVIGLSWKKQATISKEVGFSRFTVNGALRDLESWGIIDAVRTKTQAGRASVKVYRIKPFNLSILHHAFTSDQADEANGDNGLTLVETFEPIVSNQQNSFKTLDNGGDQSENKSVDNIDSMDVDQLQDFIPDVVVQKEFVAMTKPFFGTRKILSLSRALRNGLKRFGLAFHDQYVKEAVESAFKASVWSYKMNRINKNFASYFYGVLNSELAAVKRKIVRDNGRIPFYNFLED